MSPTLKVVGFLLRRLVPTVAGLTKAPQAFILSGCPRPGRSALDMSSLVLAQLLSSTLTTKNFLPARGFSSGTAKAQLQTCEVRTPVRVV